MELQPTFGKVQKINPKGKSINKVQLYREASAKIEGKKHLMKPASGTARELQMAKGNDSNVCAGNMEQNILEKSPRVQGLKFGCAVS